MSASLTLAGCDEWLRAIAPGRGLDYVAYQLDEWARVEVGRITGIRPPRRVVGYVEMRVIVARTRSALVSLDR